MESTGVPNKIQISKKTADLLIASGKKAWVVPRNDAVVAKVRKPIEPIALATLGSYADILFERNFRGKGQCTRSG